MEFVNIMIALGISEESLLAELLLEDDENDLDYEISDRGLLLDSIIKSFEEEVENIKDLHPTNSSSISNPTISTIESTNILFSNFSANKELDEGSHLQLVDKLLIDENDTDYSDAVDGLKEEEIRIRLMMKANSLTTRTNRLSHNKKKYNTIEIRMESLLSDILVLRYGSPGCLGMGLNGVVAIGTQKGTLLIFQSWMDDPSVQETINICSFAITAISLADNNKLLCTGHVSGDLFLYQKGFKEYSLLNKISGIHTSPLTFVHLRNLFSIVSADSSGRLCSIRLTASQTLLFSSKPSVTADCLLDGSLGFLHACSSSDNASIVSNVDSQLVAFCLSTNTVIIAQISPSVKILYKWNISTESSAIIGSHSLSWGLNNHCLVCCCGSQLMSLSMSDFSLQKAGLPFDHAVLAVKVTVLFSLYIEMYLHLGSEWR